ncbi:MAG TPA: peptide ABC transporter substrate-binding protein [Dehalococcoidia bacterium]|nr:peptide ABC transporter substrate-binding protein [Dehalococcoidia bacterium]
MHSRSRRWIFLVVLFAGVLGFTGLWYLVPQDTLETEPDFGGDYVEGIAGVPARVNPFFAAENTVDATLSSLVFAGLTRLDENGVPFPDLALTWTVNPDGMLYTFTLRPGLLWQDGVPLTADDVVFTYELLQSPNLRNAPAVQTVLESTLFTRLDDSTVTIELPEPFAPLPAYLTLGILPAHLLRNTPPEALYDSPFNQRPVGSGAYRIEILALDHAELVANPAYHFEQAFIQRLDLRFYSDDGAMFEALKREEINGALFDLGLGPSDILEIQQREDLRMSTLDKGEITYVYLNLDVPLFADRRLRQALLYAIDRDALIRDVLRGQASRANSPIAPGSWAYSPALTRYNADPGLANLLLDEAGWTRGEDGIRRKDATPLAFTLTTGPDPVRVAVAKRIAEAWNAVGASVIVESSGLTTLVRDTIEQRAYEALLFVDAAKPDPDPYGTWHSASRGGQGGNLAQFSDPRVDGLLTEARSASLTGRRQLYDEFQEIFAQEVPSIPLYVSRALYVQDAAVSGVRLGQLSQPGDRFWQVQEWFLKTR